LLTVAVKSGLRFGATGGDGCLQGGIVGFGACWRAAASHRGRHDLAKPIRRHLDGPRYE
jgi:hypothetical protein